MKLLIINGPNINFLGIREPAIYGSTTYKDLCGILETWCADAGASCELFQSNHEGAIVDRIQQAWFDGVDGIVMNPAAYTHTSVAILDALKAVAIPAVEVHLSDVDAREPFRHVSYAGLACFTRFTGLGFEGYRQAVLALKDRLNAG